MSPYRQAPSRELVVRRRHPTARRKAIGIVLFAAGATLAGPMVRFGAGAVVGALAVAFVGVLLAVVGRSRTPRTRLCSLVWSRGDRLGAVLLFFEVIEPRCSKKRLARNRAAVAAVHATCVRYPNRRLFPEDYEITKR